MISIGRDPIFRSPSEHIINQQEPPQLALAGAQHEHDLYHPCFVQAQKQTPHPKTSTFLRVLQCPEQNLLLRYCKMPMAIGGQSELFAGQLVQKGATTPVVIKRISFLPIKCQTPEHNNLSVRAYLANQRSITNKPKNQANPQQAALEIMVQRLSKSPLQSICHLSTERMYQGNAYWSKSYLIFPLMPADFLEAVTKLERYYKLTEPKQTGAMLRVAIATFMLSQVSQQLYNIHRYCYSHNDVKAENILCASANEQPALALADFGSASQNDAKSHPKKIAMDLQQLLNIALMVLQPSIRGKLTNEDVRQKAIAGVQSEPSYLPLAPLLMQLSQEQYTQPSTSHDYAKSLQQLLPQTDQARARQFLQQLDCKQQDFAERWQLLPT